MEIEKRVKELVEDKISDRPDIFIVSIRMLRNGILEILLDGDNGVSIEDCVAISKHVGFHLEEENVIDRAYRLEVSSAGVDSPLVLERQYIKNIGRNIRIRLVDETKREGKLVDVSENSIKVELTVKEKGKKAEVIEKEFSMNQIKETKVLISFK